MMICPKVIIYVSLIIIIIIQTRMRKMKSKHKMNKKEIPPKQ